MGYQLVQTDRLVDGIDGPVDWTILAGAVLLGSVVAWAPSGRARRPARARSALTANS